MHLHTCIRIILLCVLVMPAWRCSADDATTGALPLDAHMDKRYTDDLPGLLKKKYIRVLTTVNRTNFYIHEGHLVGYEYSLLNGYKKYLNKQVGKNKLNIVFEFIPVDRDELIPKLIRGYGDIAAAGLTITDRRSQRAAFSRPYLTGISELAVTPKGGFAPESAEDLSGKTVYVRKSSSYYTSLENLNGRLRSSDKAPVRIRFLSEELETESILEMVNSETIGITVADSHIARAWATVLKNIEVHESAALRTGSKIGWAVRKNNPKLLSSINTFLKTHKKGTLLGNIYFNRYYKDAEKLKNPIAIEQWENIEHTRQIIKKYAARYGFDWLLILAMAFQESGLDHSKKSGAGAVGIMQILPSTAKDKNIGIKNVHTLENNIHAGVKYLAFLRNRYFSSDSMRPRDQVRMSLAAYNAGPAKIRRARNMAEKMGLDRNKWFRNVELGALRIIGQETVRYVSNINKYYVLYQTLTSDERTAADTCFPHAPYRCFLHNAAPAGAT